MVTHGETRPPRACGSHSRFPAPDTKKFGPKVLSLRPRKTRSMMCPLQDCGFPRSPVFPRYSRRKAAPPAFREALRTSPENADRLASILVRSHSDSLRTGTGNHRSRTPGDSWHRWCPALAFPADEQAAARTGVDKPPGTPNNLAGCRRTPPGPGHRRAPPSPCQEQPGRPEGPIASFVRLPGLPRGRLARPAGQRWRFTGPGAARRWLSQVSDQPQCRRSREDQRQLVG